MRNLFVVLAIIIVVASLFTALARAFLDNWSGATDSMLVAMGWGLAAAYRATKEQP